MSLRGALRGSILSRGVAGGGGSSAPAPDNPPSILSFAFSDMAIDEDVSGTFTATIGGGTLTNWSLDPGDGTTPYTGSGSPISQAHTYADAGTYTAILTATGPGGSDSDTITGIEVEAASGDTWPAADNVERYFTRPWADFTFTQRNHTGSSVTYAPVEQGWHFDQGNLDPDTEELYAELGGVEVPLQVSERTFYPDGTLQNCTLVVIHAASWADDTDKTWTIKKRSGTLHAETDSRATSLITGSYDAKHTFTDVKRWADLSTWGSGTFENKLNTALGRTSILRKVWAGPLATKWWAWNYIQDTTGPTDDTLWWCIHEVTVFCDSGTDTIRAVKWEPVIGHGYAASAAPSLIYKAEAYDGASLIRDYTGTFTKAAATIDAANNQLARPNDGDAMVPSGVIYISGDVPGGLSAGYYRTQQVGETGYDSISGTLRGFAVSFLSRSTGLAIDISANGGGTFDIETRIHGYTRESWDATDDQGWSFWLTNPTQIAPNWSSAELKAMFDRGYVRSVPYDATDKGNSLPNGLTYYPMSLQIHRSLSEGPGAAAHIGETGFAAFMVMQDMSDKYRHSMMKIMAAEARHYSGSTWYEGATNGATGTRWMTHLVLDNGVDDTGTTYSGMGPVRRDYALAYNDFNYGGVAGANSYDSTESTYGNLNKNPWQGNVDGTHGSPASGWAWRFYRSSRNLWAEIGKWERNILGQDAKTLYSPQPDTGAGWREIGARVYYRLSIPLLQSAQPRGGAGTVTRLKSLLEYGSLRPEYTYFKTMIEDQFVWMKHAFENPDLIGAHAKRCGLMTTCDYGAEAPWTQGRFNQAVIDVMRARGMYAPNWLKWATAFPRGLMHDPVEGAPPRMTAVGALSGTDTGLIYWTGNDTLAGGAPASDKNKVYQLKDLTPENDETVDWSTVMWGQGHSITFQTDGERIRISTTSSARPDPVVGDFFHILKTVTLPAEISLRKLYYLYDQSGSTWKLSSTDPNVTTTPVTWTTGVERVVTSNSTAGLNWSLAGDGGTAGGWTASFNGVSDDYFYNCWSAAPMALQMYGTGEANAAACETAYDAGKAVMAAVRANLDDDKFDNGFFCRNGIEYYP